MNKQKNFPLLSHLRKQKEREIYSNSHREFRQAAGNRNCIISVDELGYS